MSSKTSPNREIYRLLAVMGSAVSIACLLVLGLIYNYGPSGSYRVDQVLLDPGSVNGLRYREGQQAFIFHKIQFMHRDPSSRGWTRLDIDANAYRRLYAELVGDESTSEDAERLRELFLATQPASLVLSVKPEYSHSPGMRYPTFQEVHFVADYYRVELRTDDANGQWAYFKHPDVLEEVVSAVRGTG